MPTDLTLADYFILASWIPAAVFWLSYGILAPWYRSALGWVIFMYSTSMVAILSLIIWSVTTGARAPEPLRQLFYGGLFLALIAKCVIFYVERHAGRGRREHHLRKASPNDEQHRALADA